MRVSDLYPGKTAHDCLLFSPPPWGKPFEESTLRPWCWNSELVCYSGPPMPDDEDRWVDSRAHYCHGDYTVVRVEVVWRQPRPSMRFGTATYFFQSGRGGSNRWQEVALFSHASELEPAFITPLPPRPDPDFGEEWYRLIYGGGGDAAAGTKILMSGLPETHQLRCKTRRYGATTRFFRTPIEGVSPAKLLRLMRDPELSRFRLKKDSLLWLIEHPDWVRGRQAMDALK